MTNPKSIEVVESYYAAFRAADALTIGEALSNVLDDEVVIDSPLIQARFGGPLAGKKNALAFAVGAAAFLKNVTIEARYVTLEGNGVVTLIHFPSPVGTVTQSEHFDVHPASAKITRLRSYYDPRKLLPPK